MSRTQTPATIQARKNTASTTPETAVHCLSNIIELTEQYDAQGVTMISQRVRHDQHVLVRRESGKTDLETEGQSSGQGESAGGIMGKIAGIINRSVKCIGYTCHRLYKSFMTEEINVEQSQISEMLARLRRKKNRVCLLPEMQDQNRRTLVMDLEETLVHLTFKKPQRYDFSVEVEVKNTILPLYVTKRFGLDSFIFEMSKLYEVVIFSSLKDSYVQKIVEKLDPKKCIASYLSREHCIVINKMYFIKPLKDLGRDMKKIVFVDTNTIAASLNPENFYRIDPFRAAEKDRKLIKLGYFLKYLHENAESKDLVPLELHRRHFQSKEIKIRDKENIPGEQPRKKGKQLHRKKNSELESILAQPHESSMASFGKV